MAAGYLMIAEDIEDIADFPFVAAIAQEKVFTRLLVRHRCYQECQP